MSVRKLRLVPLVAVTYLIVSGGPYGLEDVVGGAGYLWALVLIAVVPVVWSLPTALMVGELAGALPEEGGFYVWVRRALSPFWGFQEAWLSLAASIFDMAVYPALTVSYLAQLSPSLTAGHRSALWSLAIVAACVAWNLRGAASVGGISTLFWAALFAPFVMMIVLAIGRALMGPTGAAGLHLASPSNLRNAVLVLMWNTMGWDNASTVAREVENPQRNYIRAMLLAVAAVTLTYLIPVATVAMAGIPTTNFVTGSWAEVAAALGGRWLEIAIIAGGAITGIAIFNALTLSYARVPAAMAADGLLPHVLAKHTNRGVPWVAVLACGTAWALCSGMSFERLIELDILLYGLSLVLEFAALIALRVREPELLRPFRLPGGLGMAAMLSAMPTTLVLWALYAARDERFSFAGHSAPVLAIGAGVIAVGCLLYPLVRRAATLPRASSSPH
jgi:amino acid transporter